MIKKHVRFKYDIGVIYVGHKKKRNGLQCNRALMSIM